MDVNFSSSFSPLKSQEQANEQPLLSETEQKASKTMKESLGDQESWETDLPDLIGRIKQICPTEIQPKPTDLFYGTDLLVYTDDYQGPLALNGIKESDYKAIEKLFADLSKNSDNMFEMDLNAYDKELFLQDIKRLLTRQGGRNLLFKLENFYRDRHKKIKFIRSPTQRWMADEEVRNFVVSVNYQIKPTYAYTFDHLSGTKQPVLFPSFMLLGHELVHILHYLDDSFQMGNPTIDLTRKSGEEKGFENVEEQRTISGFSNRPEFIKVDPSLTEEEVEDWLAEYTVLNYQELNENALRAQFRFKPRVDHEGANLPIAPKDWTNQESDEFKAYVALLFERGSLSQLQELIKSGWDVNKPMQFDQETLSPLELAVGSGKLDFVKFLVKHGAILNTLNQQHESLGHLAVRENQYKLLSWLVDQGIDPLIKNHQGQTLYDLALAKEFIGLDSSAIKSMSEPFKKNFINQIFQIWMSNSSFDPSKMSDFTKVIYILQELFPSLSEENLKLYLSQINALPVAQSKGKAAKFYIEIHQRLSKIQKQKNKEKEKKAAIAKQGFYVDKKGKVHFS